MERIYKNGLLAVLTVMVLAISSAVILLDSSDSYAVDGPDEYRYVSDFASLKAALEEDNPVCVELDADIVTEGSITVKQGYYLNIIHHTLTISETDTLNNYGRVLLNDGTLNINGLFINWGDPVFQKTGEIEVLPGSSLNGTIGIVMVDLGTVTSRGTNEFSLIYNGVSLETVNLTATTYSADLGTYEYATILGPGKYTMTIDGDTDYNYSIYKASDITIVSPSSLYPPEGDNEEEDLVPLVAAIMVVAGLIVIMAMISARRR